MTPLHKHTWPDSQSSSSGNTTSRPSRTGVATTPQQYEALPPLGTEGHTLLCCGRPDCHMRQFTICSEHIVSYFTTSVRQFTGFKQVVVLSLTGRR